MLGKSHLLVGLTAGVVLDSVAEISGPHLVGPSHIQFSMVLNKALYYWMVGFGALLPDIDNARSTLGKKLGWISKEIQRFIGHRTLFHSILGLGIGAVIALGLEGVVASLVRPRGDILPAHMVLIAVTFGYLTHLVADGLTEEGVPLFWPMHTYYGFPPNRRQRFRTGTWPEHLIVFGFMLLVGLGLYYSVLTV